MTKNRVVVVGGGNAALCAALAAIDEGATVTILERAPRVFRGGNTRHTRNIRTVHAGADGYVTGGYAMDEFMRDLVGVTGPNINRTLAELTLHESESLPSWMWKHRVRWQAPLKGTLGLARTNHFFLGGGKSMLNSYYAVAEDAGIDIRYEHCVNALEIDGASCTAVVATGPDGRVERVAADAVVVAAGGFEANREWLREYWGDAALNFIVRGTPFNDGTVLRLLLDAGATSVGDPKGAHAIAVDARAPREDGGIVTRIDAVPLGIAVNCAADRFYDEGEDIWPKRYATWGRRIAEEEDQRAFAIFDARSQGEFIPGLYPPFQAPSVEALAPMLGLDPARLVATVSQFNAACPDGTAVPDYAGLDGRSTSGIVPPRSNWALRIDTPPFYAYPLRPGITFTYLGVAVNGRAEVCRQNGTFDNVFAAGEVMAGNILTRGYLAGFGLTIGSVFGRIAGRSAATC